MPKFTATFADGSTRTRKTVRQYEAAWRACTSSGHNEQVGFSRTRELAEAQRARWERAGWTFEITTNLQRGSRT